MIIRSSDDALSLLLSLVALATLVAPVLGPTLSALVLFDALCARDLSYRHVAALVGCLAVFVYGCGAWSGHLWDFRSADEYCGGNVTRAPTARLLPMAHTCFMADGTTHQLVSPIVNPALLACLVAGVAIAVRGGRRARRQRLSVIARSRLP